MNENPHDGAHAAHKASPRCRPSQDASHARAAFYGLVLRQQGYAANEAAALVMERYPQTRPFLERLTRSAAADPLEAVRNGKWGGGQRMNESVARYRSLHDAFDQLLAEYLTEHPRALPSTVTALMLLEWSARRCGFPDSDTKVLGGIDARIRLERVVRQGEADR